MLTGCEPPRTHDLVYLMELAVRQGVAVPIDLDDADALYPYAVEFRYAGAPPDSALDVSVMLALAEAVVAWAAGLTEPPPRP
jgi:HEPN domain